MKSIGRLWPQYLPVPKNGESNEPPLRIMMRSEEHTSELQSQSNLVCRLLLEKKKKHPLVRLAAGPHLHPIARTSALRPRQWLRVAGVASGACLLPMHDLPLQVAISTSVALQT